MPVPTYDNLFEPLFQSLKELGGSASNSELEDSVSSKLNLSEEDISEQHGGKANSTKFSYRLAWARSYLKKSGLIENTSRGIWVLTPKGKHTNLIDKKGISRKVREQSRKGKDLKDNYESVEEIEEQAILDEEGEGDKKDWQDKLLDLIKSMPPDSFERLCQRLLRESGFIQVEVTSKSRDGGLDGTGILRIGGFLSFHIIFQAKRYKDSVSSPVIRDFRGAMVGRADKGLIITTGTFTKDARKEAQRDGATPIDLVDGNDLIMKLKELGLGMEIKEKIVEDVIIDENWYNSI